AGTQTDAWNGLPGHFAGCAAGGAGIHVFLPILHAENDSRYNGAEVARVGNVSERGNGYIAPDGTAIPKGNYTIGEEIPAGTYKVYFNGTTTSRVRVFKDAQEAGNTFNKGKETILDFENTEGTVTLSEGNILRVEYSPIIMTKGTGFTFD
ncbi:MAG: hypothetical protein IJ088_06265, partial [Clostridia bacterium]|nr:hypothetical protein [Clostridia bacterium]